MFLAANNFFWQVRRDGQAADEGGALAQASAGPRRRSSASSSSQATTAAGRRAYVVARVRRGRSRGPASGTGTTSAATGIEIDARSPESPPGTQVLASIPNLMGPGRTAEMTYYETPAGAKVFAAGTLNFAASIGDPAVAQPRRERLGRRLQDRP